MIKAKRKHLCKAEKLPHMSEKQDIHQYCARSLSGYQVQSDQSDNPLIVMTKTGGDDKFRPLI